VPAFGALTFDRSAHFHLRRTTNGNGFVNMGILRGGWSGVNRTLAAARFGS
jgi:hypothetical protein